MSPMFNDLQRQRNEDRFENVGEERSFISALRRLNRNESNDDDIQARIDLSLSSFILQLKSTTNNQNEHSLSNVNFDSITSKIYEGQCRSSLNSQSTRKHRQSSSISDMLGFIKDVTVQPSTTITAPVQSYSGSNANPIHIPTKPVPRVEEVYDAPSAKPAKPSPFVSAKDQFIREVGNLY